MAKAEDIIARLAVVLASVSGLSTDRVVRGQPSGLNEGASPPVAWLYVDGPLTSTFEAELTSVLFRLSVVIIAVPNVSGSTHALKEAAALDFCDGIGTAIQGDSTLQALLYDAPQIAGALTYDVDGIGPAVVALRVDLSYILDYGSGV